MSPDSPIKIERKERGKEGRMFYKKQRKERKEGERRKQSVRMPSVIVMSFQSH